MKVAIFTYTMDRKAMGSALYTRALVEHLLKNDSSNLELYLVHREHTDDPLYKKAHEIILPRVRLPRLAFLFSEMLFLWKERNSFDIIHYPQESNYPLFWLTNAKVIITMHSAVEGWKEFGLMRRRYWFVYWMLNFFSKSVGALVASSRSTKESVVKLSSFPEEKVHVVHLGVGDEYFNEYTKEELQKVMKEKYGITSPYILNGSRVDPHKNIVRLLEAYVLLKEENPNLPKLVIGARHFAPEVKRVDAAIENLQLKDDIIFMPYIDTEDMPKLYQGAEFFVFPSLHEGFGLPIVEAMAAGTPVITSNVFSMPEVAGGAALIIDPYNVRSIKDAMSRLLDDGNLARALVEKGRERARQFSWDKMAEEMFDVYNAVYEEKANNK